jgi:hypothetical protein
MIYPYSFEVDPNHVELVYKSNEIILDTNWCQDGKMQEKGIAAEELVFGLLSLCNVEVIRSKKSSVLDEILKVDIVCRNKSECNDVFAFQVKSSMTGAIQHHSKYGTEIKYENYYFKTPWCLIIDGSLSNSEVFDLLIEELLLDIDPYLNLSNIKDVALEVLSSNSKRINICKTWVLTKQEQKALRLIYNIGKNKATYFLKS